MRQRSSIFQIPATNDGVQPPNKNWHPGFCERQDLKPRTLKPLEWERHNISEKVENWFALIGNKLHDPAILAENVYNMDETGIVWSRLTSRKVLLHRNDLRRYRGAGSKRTQVTAIECISADGKCLNPSSSSPRQPFEAIGPRTRHLGGILRVPPVATTTVTLC